MPGLFRVHEKLFHHPRPGWRVLSRLCPWLLPRISTIVVGPVTSAGSDVTLSVLHGTIEPERRDAA